MRAPARDPARRGLALLLGLLGLGGVAGADEVAPGSYCPLPEAGERPACLAPAEAEFGEFFGAVEAGPVEAAPLAEVEAEVARGAAGERAYLALSSLAYGYYRLSQRAAAAEDLDPAIAARLERWNGLLARAFSGSGEVPAYRRAVREAAVDLRRRAPPVRLRCLDAEGETVACDSTEAMLRGLDAAAGEVGFGGGLRRVLERLFGDGGS